MTVGLVRWPGYEETRLHIHFFIDDMEEDFNILWGVGGYFTVQMKLKFPFRQAPRA